MAGKSTTTSVVDVPRQFGRAERKHGGQHHDCCMTWYDSTLRCGGTEGWKYFGCHCVDCYLEQQASASVQSAAVPKSMMRFANVVLSFRVVILHAAERIFIPFKARVLSEVLSRSISVELSTCFQSSTSDSFWFVIAEKSFMPYGHQHTPSAGH